MIFPYIYKSFKACVAEVVAEMAVISGGASENEYIRKGEDVIYATNS